PPPTLVPYPTLFRSSATCRCGRPPGPCPTSRCFSTSTRTAPAHGWMPTTSRSTGSRPSAESSPSASARRSSSWPPPSRTASSCWTPRARSSSSPPRCAPASSRCWTHRGLSARTPRLDGMQATDTATPPGTEAPLPWGSVWGQDAAVDVLRDAASDPSAMTHAWLITGPPGSGRSTLAYAFAAALIADPADEAAEQVMRQVLAGTHPDLTALRTEGVIISVKDARALVERSYFAPSLGRYRVIVVEDAARMVERTSNVLLTALAEPPERTVWVLCAPSEADLLPTIRSRVRALRLREPDVDDV